MEAEFLRNEQSIKDMVTREAQKEVSKFQTAKNKQSSRKPADARGPRSNSRSASRGRNKAKSGQNPNGKTTQKRQSRSTTRCYILWQSFFFWPATPTVKKRQKPRQRLRKIDQRDQYAKWLDKMANKPILDLLPRNLEFHNLSHLTLTTTQSLTLGLGLKFRPTRQPPAARVFDNQIQDFCRSVRLHYKYADKPEDTDFNPKLYVKSNWNPPREDPDLEENLYKTRRELLTNFSNNRPQWKPNLSREELCGLRDLKDDPSVRVLATDKNLGPRLHGMGGKRDSKTP